MEISLKNVAVEEQRSGQGHQRQTQPAQPQGEEGQDDGDDRRQHRTDDAADEQVEAEVVGELRRP